MQKIQLILLLFIVVFTTTLIQHYDPIQVSVVNAKPQQEMQLISTIKYQPLLLDQNTNKIHTTHHQSSSSLAVDQQQLHSVISQELSIASIKNIHEERHVLNETSSNSTTNSTTTNYGSCNPLLFQLGSFSRDGPNLLYGMCPDTWLTPAVASTYFVVYTILIALCGIGLYWKRNSPHIKARSITNMFMTIISNSGFIVLTSLRFIIGRRIYPCSLYILSYFLIPPGILLPSVFRLWRLFFMHKLNLQKTTEIVKTNENVGKSNIKSDLKNPQLDMVLSIPSVTSVASSLNLGVGSENTGELTDTSDDNASYWVDNELERQKNEKLQKIYNILLSQKFVLGTYAIAFIIHIFFFIFFGSIEEGIHSQDPTKLRVFMGEGGFFVSTRGCLISTPITIIVAIEAAFYIIVEIILLVLCVIIPQDTWFIKRESLLSVFIQLVFAACFAICGFIVQVSKFTDFFVPYGYSIMMYSIVELIICDVCPILYKSEKKNHDGMDEESELQQFLKNKKTFNILLDFARRSYCPESVLCFEDIERFKLTNKKNRKRAAIHITNTYLKPNSPLELNFPNLSQTHELIMKQINDSSQPLDPKIFNSIQWHCIEDMTDVFDRLKKQSKETRKILQEWKAVATTTATATSTANDVCSSQQQLVELKNTSQVFSSVSSSPSICNSPQTTIPLTTQQSSTSTSQEGNAETTTTTAAKSSLTDHNMYYM